MPLLSFLCFAGSFQPSAMGVSIKKGDLDIGLAPVWLQAGTVRSIRSRIQGGKKQGMLKELVSLMHMDEKKIACLTISPKSKGWGQVKHGASGYPYAALQSRGCGSLQSLQEHPCPDQLSLKEGFVTITIANAMEMLRNRWVLGAKPAVQQFGSESPHGACAHTLSLVMKVQTG